MRILTLALATLFPLLAVAGIRTELTSTQLNDLERGQQVVVKEEVEGRPWPRLRIYQKVAATPEEVLAVFCDYAQATTFVPDVIKSEISRMISPCVLEVDYQIDIPMLPDESYTTRNSLSSSGDSYKVAWVLVRALQTKASEGTLRVEPAEGGALLCYTNLVTPGSSMAGLLRIPAIERMKTTVAAIVKKVEKQKAEAPAALQKQILRLREALTADPDPGN